MARLPKSELCVVLVSGGMDSATVLGIAAFLGYSIAAIHFNYNQRSKDKELQAFDALCDFYGVKRKIAVDMSFLSVIGGSALTDDAIAVPDNLPETGEIPPTYVPFRNGIMISMAAAWAEVIGAKKIFVGVVEEDSSGYPDCRESFIKAMEEAVNLGRKPESELRIVAPLIHLRKAQIVKIGVTLGVPYELTWSCYHGREKHCGKCPACRLRRKAFSEAGIPDPTVYEQ